MPFEIITPSEIEEPLYESIMELVKGTVRKDQQETVVVDEPGPIVTLGKPQWWNLAKLAREKGEMLPPEMLLLMRDADFYLVQLACSFKPERQSKVEWAQFTAFLRPKRSGYGDPIAFDLYPLQVCDMTQKDIKVSIAPSLKFANVEGTLGEIVTVITYKKLEPIITGFGALQSNPCWEFEQYDSHPLRGSRFTYLVVKKPHGTEAVRMSLDITADVVTERHRLLSARVTKKDREYLTQVICTEY